MDFTTPCSVTPMQKVKVKIEIYEMDVEKVTNQRQVANESRKNKKNAQFPPFFAGNGNCGGQGTKTKTKKTSPPLRVSNRTFPNTPAASSPQGSVRLSSPPRRKMTLSAKALKPQFTEGGASPIGSLQDACNNHLGIP